MLRSKSLLNNTKRGHINSHRRSTIVKQQNRRNSTKTMSEKATIKVGLCQMTTSTDKQVSIETARKAITHAAESGAKIVVLPECFQCPYDTSAFPQYQEPIPSLHTGLDKIDSTTFPSVHFLATQAKTHGIYIVGGSIPEIDDGKIYNTSTVYDPDGTLVAKHRKLHLFDIDIPGRMTFRESDTLSPGNAVTMFQIPSTYIPGSTRPLSIGLGICYDIRFAEYAQSCRRKGADMLIYPGAFNTVTGPAHWELLQRGRALDNQLYVVTCSPSRNPDSKYQAWGHSTVVNPWGEVIATTDEHDNVIIAEIDIGYIDTVRQQIPISFQRREDAYQI